MAGVTLGFRTLRLQGSEVDVVITATKKDSPPLYRYNDEIDIVNIRGGTVFYTLQLQHSKF
ncbi:hypothetical protein A6E05_10450 [Aliivibrio sp. 1S165]|nr:hypothetical protein A6E05_10450 [Aliivibrio sp. 1S165]OCH35909.1 hypothetical protein A6E06_11180 [Aliivibrio sp. 1S175]